MDNKSFAVLEYYRIRDTVAGFCLSEEGRASLLRREPSSDHKNIHFLKKIAAEWTRCCESHSSLFKGWSPVQPLFTVLDTEGAALSLENVHALGLFCLACEHVKSRLLPLAEEGAESDLHKTVSQLPDLKEQIEVIYKIIDQSGQMRELAEIREIKKTIAAIRRDIEVRIRSYTASAAFKDALQSDVPTIRGERQVLAVKANFRSRVRGIVHEVSQTGQTVYIEPDDVVKRNNDLIEQEFRLSREIIRILRELTARLAKHKADFEEAYTLMLTLDAAYAVSRWGVQNRCVFAADANVLLLKQARHPLLGTDAVPIDISFFEKQKVLIITGANTGGKTVALKTAALCVLLNQSGFPVPAAEETALPLFDNVFADIGDEQSIDQSLSTFSGHMKNVAHIAREATEHSMILLDELGSGTDTQEGGAIAMAILDFLLKKKSCVLVTTHHGILKNYGYTHAECANASVEFDESTLSPSYRILMGIPGESHALDIAAGSGLPTEITTAAKSYLENEQADVSALIRGLSAKHEELDKAKTETENKEIRVREKLEKVAERELKIQEQEAELREKISRGLSEFTSESRKLLENLVRELREGEITRDKTLKVKDFIAELEQKLELEKKDTIELREKIATARTAAKKKRSLQGEISANRVESSAKSEKTLEVGMDVFIRDPSVSTVKQGNLLRRGKKGYWIVQAGNIKLTVAEENLSVAPKALLRPSISVETAISSENQTESAAFELRLLGMRLDEALKTLERQIDIANLQGLREFSVIHGKGNGVLQQGVQEYLKKSPLVSDFTFALPEAGGTGKTHVRLK